MRLFITLILLLNSTLSIAQGCPDSPAMVANECLSNQLRNAEATLTENYSRLLGPIPINEPNQIQMAKTLLAKSQEAWLAYRKARCEFKGFMEGGVGSYKAVRENQCLVQITEQRAAELIEWRRLYE